MSDGPVRGAERRPQEASGGEAEGEHAAAEAPDRRWRQWWWQRQQLGGSRSEQLARWSAATEEHRQGLGADLMGTRSSGIWPMMPRR